MKETIGGIALFCLAFYGALKLGKYIGRQRDPRRKQHDHKLNPNGFDDGEEYDNHIHV